MFPLDVHFNATSMANILSFQAVASLEGVRITMDTVIEHAINVEYQDKCYKFKECKDGLYYFDTETMTPTSISRDKLPPAAPTSDKDNTFHNVDKQQEELYTPTEIKSAVRARTLTQLLCGTNDDKIDHFNDQNFIPGVDKNTNDPVNSYSFLTTVNGNKEYFTKHEIERADQSRRLQTITAYPSDDAFRFILKNNLITNCKITIDDFERALHIYGTALPLLQGKMTRLSSTRVHNISRVPLPPPISSQHHNITLGMDFIFVNGLPFMHTKSKKINFLSILPVPSRSMAQIIKGIETIKLVYKRRGFSVTDYRADNEFNKEKIHAAVLPATMHNPAADAHVDFIERSGRTIKESARTLCQSLPYKRYPIIMTKALMAKTIHWLNYFPSKNGVSSTMGPATIVLGKPKPDFNKLTIPFGLLLWLTSRQQTP